MGEAFLYLYTWILALMIFGTVFLAYVVVQITVQSVRERRREQSETSVPAATAPEDPPLDNAGGRESS